MLVYKDEPNMSFRQRLKQKKPVLLDGAMGSELQRYGLSIQAPLWTSEPLLTYEGQQIVKTIHSRYAQAGAEVITLNSFRTNNHTLKNTDSDINSKLLTIKAAELARRGIIEANVGYPIFIAGSMTTVGDCYHPDRIPDIKTLSNDHRCSIRNLVAAGVDFILAETINSSMEAEIILDIAQEEGAEVAISFVCANTGKLLNGESLSNVVPRLVHYNPISILVNCTDFQGTREALNELAHFSHDIPIGAYPNVENRDALPHNTHVDCYLAPKFDLTEYNEFMCSLIAEYNVKIVGGCCGTNPDYIKKISTAIS